MSLVVLYRRICRGCGRTLTEWQIEHTRKCYTCQRLLNHAREYEALQEAARKELQEAARKNLQEAARKNLQEAARKNLQEAERCE